MSEPLGPILLKWRSRGRWTKAFEWMNCDVELVVVLGLGRGIAVRHCFATHTVRGNCQFYDPINQFIYDRLLHNRIKSNNIKSFLIRGSLLWFNQRANELFGTDGTVHNKETVNWMRQVEGGWMILRWLILLRNSANSAFLRAFFFHGNVGWALEQEGSFNYIQSITWLHIRRAWRSSTGKSNKSEWMRSHSPGISANFTRAATLDGLRNVWQWIITFSMMKVISINMSISGWVPDSFSTGIPPKGSWKVMDIVHWMESWTWP